MTHAWFYGRYSFKNVGYSSSEARKPDTLAIILQYVLYVPSMYITEAYVLITRKRIE